MFEIDIDIDDPFATATSYTPTSTPSSLPIDLHVWPLPVHPPAAITSRIPERYTIWRATSSNDLPGLKLLLADGNHVDERNDSGATPLHLCASLGHAICASFLINAGADVNALDEESHYTPLHRAIYHSRIGLILLLLEHGAKLGVQRSTSLSLKSVSKNKQDGGISKDYVDDSVVDREGHTPLDLCSLPIRDALRTAASTLQGGDVYSFGKTSNFSLGYLTGSKQNLQSSPRRIGALMGLSVLHVATSEYHALAVTRQGHLYSWGGGRGGRLAASSFCSD